jgi:hypothetical protein
MILQVLLSKEDYDRGYYCQWYKSEKGGKLDSNLELPIPDLTEPEKPKVKPKPKIPNFEKRENQICT